jgi:hypothetical protein
MHTADLVSSSLIIWLTKLSHDEVDAVKQTNSGES